MEYKKIILTAKSWFITDLESDTILSYIFAYNFEKLKNVYDKFLNWDSLPFLISSWFDEGTLVKPIYFSSNNIEKTDSTLIEDISFETNRKDLKKMSIFPIRKKLFELLFNWNQVELKEELINILDDFNKKLKNSKLVSEYKNSIPRFNIWDTNPYSIENIKYNSWNKVIYVKVYDESDFNLFFKCLKNTFNSIWFWKAKSRWYWQFSNIELEDLDNNEKDCFTYFENLEKEKNLKIVLNNYKPSVSEIEDIDLSKSFYKLNNKHTKSLSEFNKTIFKWKMSFFAPWSVISTNQKLKGDFYKSWNSCNFGFIF